MVYLFILIVNEIQKNSTENGASTPDKSEEKNEERSINKIEENNKSNETIKEGLNSTNKAANNNTKEYPNYDPNLSIIITSSNEDEIAKNWIYIFTVCIFISLIVFIYNVIKCYNKNQIVQRSNDTRTYSKELQTLSATDDDPVIDLSN